MTLLPGPSAPPEVLTSFLPRLSYQIVQKLLVSAKGEEVRFLVRGLIQNLRVRSPLTAFRSRTALSRDR